ncbi:hypothetical protein BDZ90DRAFT_229848 [Jaminaea rosea]|uniref:PXA domain-containing protein n=1 Tax=Jaminaea rosea TaxID=1569628 RepID=A0A316UZX5_9BASI|nr:hypothetical protein BDZ90DRAFT_229848 [Jaminaea rosea]PWN30857.1 hypothetical protein BDZ90DRAFT_229848 [Jaminaea rosea]
MSSSPKTGEEVAASPRPTSPSSSPDTSSPSPTPHSSSGLSPAHLITAASVALGLLLLRSGFFNVVLVVATSVLLLLNPYVRTFLDLPPGKEDGQGGLFGLLDPAGYFTSFSFTKKSMDNESDDEEGDKESRQRRGRDYEDRQLAPLPAELKQSLDQLAPLVVRDFVNGWYTHHSFGYPVFPRAVRSTIDHMVASVYTRTITSRLHAVDVTTELLLTGSSVFLTCLRRKRNAKAAADAGDRMAAQALRRGGTGHWNSNEERIASLRSAMRAFFERHLPPHERESDLIFNLITEVLTKQLWNLILTLGEPDFLNRNLVAWKESQVAVASAAPPGRASMDTPSTGATGPSPPSRPLSRAPDMPLSPTALPDTGSEIPRPPSTIQGERSRPASTAPEKQSSTSQPPPLPQRSGTLNVPSPGPDRNMISTPPTRSDSPMMPSFVASQQPRAIPRMMSPMRPASPSAQTPIRQNTTPASGAPPRMQSPSAYNVPSPSAHRGSVAGYPQRTSSDLQDGFSAVVGGLGSAIKGIGKGADAIAGGIGDALISNQPDDEPPSRSPYRHSNPHSEAWQRGSAAVNDAASRPDVLQPSNNAVRRKQPPSEQSKGQNSSSTDEMASQPAWPSNLPHDFNGVAEGDNLPESLKASLRTASPSRISSPPSMMTSQPYRRSQDPIRSRPESPAVSRSQGASGEVAAAATQPSQALGLPPRPPAPASGPELPPRPIDTEHASKRSSIPPAPALDSVLSRSDSEGLYDAFEAFLENPRRDMPKSGVSIVLGEGEELLRLHIGLATIERLVPKGAGEESEMFREDASSILSKARDGLRRALDSAPVTAVDVAPAQTVARSLDTAISQLGFGSQGFDAKEGTVRDALEPVRERLMSRLETLYAAFWRQRMESKSTTAAPKSAGTGLAYEPRRKDPHAAGSSAPAATGTPLRSNAGLPSQPPLQRTSFEAGGGIGSASASPIMAKRASLQAPKPRSAMMDQLIRLGDDDDDDDEHEHHDAESTLLGPTASGQEGTGGVLVTVTDISSNVERPSSQVDIKTFEFMCAVEPSPAAMAAGSSGTAGGTSDLFESSGGFVLVRRWAEVVTMDRDLRKTAAVSQGVSLPPLPTTKGRTSSTLSSDLEMYLAKILSTPELASTSPVAQFADRTRAAAAAEAVGKGGFNPFSSGVELGRNLGRNFVEGVGAVGKAASTGLQQQLVQPMGTGGPQQGARSVGPAPAPRTVKAGESVNLHSSREANEADPTSRTQSPVKQLDSGGTHAPLPTAPRGLSPRALDALLTSMFALADEALSLTGAWSMRRGVVRLLQSVIRQSYSAAIVSAFEGTTSALSVSSVSGWMDKARTTFWSQDEAAKWIYVKGAPRTARDRVQSEEAARKVVLGYAPAQAAFVLGPGGKQACERGLEAIHGVVCEDEGALDLVLTLALRLIQMV